MSSDADDLPGFYGRMLPERDEPIEALGALLNSTGAVMALVGIVWWPVMFGSIGLILTGSSLLMARSRRASRAFAIGFTVAGVAWLIGIMHATITSKDIGIW